MIIEFIAKTWLHWKLLVKDPAYVISLLSGIILLTLALMTNAILGAYNDSFVYLPVGDIILDRIPTFDSGVLGASLEFLFTWGFFASIYASVLYAMIWKPELFPFGLKTFAVLIFIRVCFTMLTNFGPPSGFYYANGFGSLVESTFAGMIFRNDLFFSGHVAMPFLSFLIFKKTRFKWIMLVTSLVMGVTVLLMHVHYSIDVFSAFFITYGIYALSNAIFNNLNLRFKKRLEMYSWNIWKKGIINMREKRELTGPEKENYVEEKKIVLDQYK